MSTSKITENVGFKIGKYIKYQREKRGKSLNEFAAELGIATSFLLRLEQGKYHTVKFDVIEKVARGLEMEIEDFLAKCEIISPQSKFPPLEYYLKEVYQYPVEAISDIKMFLDFISIKYKKEIKRQQQAHKNYWNKK